MNYATRIRVPPCPFPAVVSDEGLPFDHWRSRRVLKDRARRDVAAAVCSGLPDHVLDDLIIRASAVLLLP